MPTTITIQPLAADGYEAKIDEANPSTVYTDPDPLQIKQSSGARKYSFVQFWLDSLPAGAVITQAKFGFYVEGQTGDKTLKIYKVVDAWYKNTVTWATRPINGVTPIIQEVEDDTAYEVDITEIVQYWIANSAWNLGFCLVGDLCSDSTIDITGSACDDPAYAPYLEITYAPPLGVTGNWQIAAEYQVTGLTENKITLSGLAGDTDKEYMLLFQGNQTVDGYPEMRINDVGDANHYVGVETVQTPAGAHTPAAYSYTGIVVNLRQTANYWGNSIHWISVINGKKPQIISYNNQIPTGIHNNRTMYTEFIHTTPEITSITITAINANAYFQVGTRVVLFKRVS